MIRSYTHELQNGLRVVCVEMPHLHAAELAIYLKVGGRNDPPGKSGLSHFLEHMLFRGTRDFPSSLEIENAFETIGGAPNAATDAESTCYYSRIHPDHIRRGMEIFASMLLNPLLEGIDTEKRIITEEAREDLNEQGEEINPDTIASRMLWPRHPLGLPTIGTLESINGVCRKDLADHLQAFYRPNAAVVVVSGPVRSHEIFAGAEAVFGSWHAAPLPPAKTAITRPGSPRTCLVQDSDSQMALQLAFLGLPRSDSRFTSLRLIRRILAGGGSSRLYLRLREELGIIYSVEASIGSYDETGCLAIDLSTAPETLLQAIETTIDELYRIACEPMPTEELERVRQSYIFDLEFSRDSAYEMGGRYGWGELMNVVRSIEDDRQAALDTSAEEITATAKLIFSPANLRLVAVGPWKRGLKKQVKALIQQYQERFQLQG
jgi:predicted Zn-dependent peptidase